MLSTPEMKGCDFAWILIFTKISSPVNGFSCYLIITNLRDLEMSVGGFYQVYSNPHFLSHFPPGSAEEGFRGYSIEA